MLLRGTLLEMPVFDPQIWSLATSSWPRSSGAMYRASGTRAAADARPAQSAVHAESLARTPMAARVSALPASSVW